MLRFELFRVIIFIFFRSKYFTKRLKKIFDVVDSEPNVQNLEPYDNLKKYIIKANPNNSIFEEVNNFNQTSKPEIDENILLYFDL